jgi:peptide deformylase
VNATGELIDDLEGCLSYPGLAIKQKRWQEVRVRFNTPDGDTHTKTWQGVTARVIQHELNHIEGMPWYHVSKLKMNRAIKDAKKRGWEYSGQGLLKYCS